MQPPSPAPALRFIRLALDPSEGKLGSWPLDVRRGSGPTGEENVYVAALTQWPDEPTAQRMLTLARGGGTVILFLQPGLEDSWESLPAAQKDALTALLPSAPAKTTPAGAYRAALSAARDSIMQGLDDPNIQINNIVVRRFVAMSTTEPSVTTILSISPTDPGQGARQHGLLFRKTIGVGAAYAFATLPESRYASLGTHALFLPLMVRMSLPSAQQSAAQNIELGQPLMLSGPRYAEIAQLEVETPKREVILVPVSEDPKAGRRFAMENVTEPGLYTWRKPGDDKPIAMSNVQLPSAEADLNYREANSILTPGPNVLVARSLDELQAKMATVSEPSPQWSGLIAFVLFLICLEALMGSISKLWKPIPLRSFIPGLRTPTPTAS
jgi:hypothetical protein